jgi:hypothetical protein
MSLMIFMPRFDPAPSPGFTIRSKTLSNTSRKTAAFLNEAKVSDFFAQLILTYVPKSHARAIGEERSAIDYSSLLLPVAISGHCRLLTCGNIVQVNVAAACKFLWR